MHCEDVVVLFSYWSVLFFKRALESAENESGTC